MRLIESHKEKISSGFVCDENSGVDFVDLHDSSIQPEKKNTKKK